MKLLITTVVDENYQHFMPLFIYCCKMSYPEYDIKIFTDGTLSFNVAAAFKLIPSGFDIVLYYFKDWEHHTYSPISWRFAIDKEEYKGYDYIYVTDIDMMILREKVDLINSINSDWKDLFEEL